MGSVPLISAVIRTSRRLSYMYDTYDCRRKGYWTSSYRIDEGFESKGHAPERPTVFKNVPPIPELLDLTDGCGRITRSVGSQLSYLLSAVQTVQQDYGQLR